MTYSCPVLLPKIRALTDPTQAKPSSITDGEQRNIDSFRFSNKTTIDLGEGHQVDVGAFVTWKDLYHPILSVVGLLDNESIDYGLYAQSYGSYQMGGHLNRYRMGVTTHFGNTDAKTWENNGGSPGALTANSNRNAQNVVLYGENSFYIQPQLSLVTSLQYIWVNRHVYDQITPNESASADYNSFNPKVGILYKPKEKVQIFANISKSYEPPDFSNLTQGNTVGFSQLEAQDAWTAEIGTRGERGPVAWDISLYRAWIKDELLRFRATGAFTDSTFNAEDTVHQGAEVGLGFRLGQNLFTGGDRLKWWNAYTFSQFFFDGDSTFGDNEIPGQPPHFYNSELRYDHPDNWFVAMNAFAASRTDADFNNTFTVPGFAIVGIGAGYNINKHTSLFFEGRNLLNKKYISNLSAAATATSASANFYPGDLRRFFGGVRISF